MTSAAYTIPLTPTLALDVPANTNVSGLVWGNLAFAAVLEHHGYEDIARQEVEKIAAYLRRPPTEAEAPIRSELPEAERGRSGDELKRLAHLDARIANPAISKAKREAAETERERLITAPQARAEQAWRDQATQETVDLAQARGEDVEVAKSGKVRVRTRDPLLSLLDGGHLTAEQYDTGLTLRDLYERRSEGLGSQMGAIGGTSSPTYDNSKAVFAGVQRAKAINHLAFVEARIVVRLDVNALTLMRVVCERQLPLSCQGKGRAFERNAKTLAKALDVAGDAR